LPFSCAASTSSRIDLGLPASWARIERWLHEGSLPSTPPEEPATPVKRKFKNIPVMDNYDCNLPENFWANFPESDLPKVPFEKIDIDRLEYLIEGCKPKLLASEYQRALKC
jgi:hypothetical protein